MKKYLFLILIIVLPAVISCSNTKEITERRSLMMPKLSDQPRNSGKYKEITYSKKTNNQKRVYKKSRRR